MFKSNLLFRIFIFFRSKLCISYLSVPLLSCNFYSKRFTSNFDDDNDGDDGVLELPRLALHPSNHPKSGTGGGRRAGNKIKRLQEIVDSTGDEEFGLRLYSLSSS